MFYTYYEQKKVWHKDAKGLTGIVKKYTFWSLTDFCTETVELISAEVMLISGGEVIRRAKVNKLPEIKLNFINN